MSSAFGRPAPGKSEIVLMLEQEMLGRSHLLNSVLRNCHAKCINQDYKQGELFKGESVCVDRCVSKFMLVTEYMMKIQREKQEADAQAQAQ